MQPEPSQVTQKSSPQKALQDPKHLHHYGHQQQEEHTLSGPSSGEPGGAGSSDAGVSAATSTSLAASGSPASKPPVARVNSESPPASKSPVNRISEYEKASFNTSKKSDVGPAFTVVPLSKRSGLSQVYITDFPNG